MPKNKYLNIAMLGHKHVLSRGGGIEIVVNELATRMVAKGHRVICYDRKSHHVSGSELDNRREYKDIKIISVWTIEKRGLATRSKADIVHIHAEGPAAMCGLVKLLGKRTEDGSKKKVVVTIHGLDWQSAKWGRIRK